MVFVAIVSVVSPLAAISDAQAAASTVSLRVSPATALPGESVVLSGAVSPLVSGRTVSLQRYGRSWSTVASVVTSPNGRFSLLVRAGVAGSATSWRAVARRTSVAGQAISPARSVAAIRQVVSLRAPVSTVVRQAFLLWGSTYPVRAGRVVVVQRLSGRSWVWVGRTTTSSAGRYSMRTRVWSAHTFSYRAVAARFRGAAGVVSVRRLVSARLAQATPAAFRLDYQTGNFSQWTERHLHRAAQEAIVSRPARVGYPHTARFVVAPGDYTNGGTSAERSEVMASIAQTGNPRQGQTMWFAWSTFIPAGTHVDSNATSPVGNGWLIFTQWHGTANSGPGPNIAFALTKGTSRPRLVLDTNGGSGSGRKSEWVQSTALPLGQWVDFVVGVTWGTSSSVGRMTVKTNGKTWLNNAPCANLYPGQSAYVKQGIYRASSRQTQTIYHTGTRRGLTLASVTR